VRASGFVSGHSSHSDRLRVIRGVHDRYAVLIDPHTADGVKVALEEREPNVPMICLETAQPAKFEETIVASIGRTPERPAAYADLESKPQRFDTMKADAQHLKDYIAARAA